MSGAISFPSRSTRTTSGTSGCGATRARTSSNRRIARGALARRRDREDPVAGAEPRGGRSRAGRDGADERAWRGLAVLGDGEDEVDEHREDEVRDRPGDGDREPPPRRLLEEAAALILGGEVLGLVAASPAIFTYPPSGKTEIQYSVSPRRNPNSRAEADREPEHLHAERLRDEEVPELVDEDEPPEEEDDRAELDEGPRPSAVSLAAPRPRCRRTGPGPSRRGPGSIGGQRPAGTPLRRRRVGARSERFARGPRSTWQAPLRNLARSGASRLRAFGHPRRARSYRYARVGVPLSGRRRDAAPRRLRPASAYWPIARSVRERAVRPEAPPAGACAGAHASSRSARRARQAERARSPDRRHREAKCRRNFGRRARRTSGRTRACPTPRRAEHLGAGGPGPRAASACRLAIASSRGRWSRPTCAPPGAPRRAGPSRSPRAPARPSGASRTRGPRGPPRRGRRCR